MKRGAYDYLTKPFHLPELEIHLQKAYEKVQLARRERQWVEQLAYESTRFRLIGSSHAIQKVVQLIQKVVVTIELPTLAERREDIPALIEHFLATRRIGSRPARIEPEALSALVRHDWPGNVRELANVLERAQILAEQQVITLDDLPDNIAEPAADAATGDPRHLKELERRYVREVLEQEKGNKARAAKALGISRRALYRLIDKYNLEEH